MAGPADPPTPPTACFHSHRATLVRSKEALRQRREKEQRRERKQHYGGAGKARGRSAGCHQKSGVWLCIELRHSPVHHDLELRLGPVHQEPDLMHGPMHQVP